MNKNRIIIAVVALLVVAFIVVVLKRFGIGEGEGKSGPIARVQVAKVQRKVISEKEIVYGSVVAQPGKMHSVAVAFETRVRHILVAPGQFVQENDPLTEIEPSPAAQLQMQQAKNASEAAQKELKQTQARF
jgi:multidrug efflux pump subunit AcrA (membrane-fusion protein)